MATISEYLEFTADEIPSEKIYNLDGTDYKFLVQYNTCCDFYTCTIKDMDNNILIVNRLTYLSTINDGVIKGLNISRKIIPVNYDDPDNGFDINQSNFKQINLMLVDV